MSRVACAWADLVEDADTETWYEETHVSDAASKIASIARNCEQVEDNMFKEVPGIEGRYMTLYDLPDDATNINAQILPDPARLPEDTKIETRIYDELPQTSADSRELPDVRDIQMFIVVRWQPVAAVHDDFVEWFRNEFAPGMLESPELLRTRIFKIQEASTFENNEVKDQSTSNMFQYMTIWEFDCDELPWEILVYLGSSERWRYYVEGGHLQWQIAQYLVNRVYPEDDAADSPAAKRASILVTSPPGEGSDQEHGSTP
ncbi:hypothetical protein IQ06DRAFT_296634 [Phaeosphaeriaceae sp. SRC1lsM3a]|nr:hypothetical protein IQ06DRAFT_296634 [Stagonospora sp. SRC1lsM3a]